MLDRSSPRFPLMESQSMALDTDGTGRVALGVLRKSGLDPDTVRIPIQARLRRDRLKTDAGSGAVLRETLPISIAKSPRRQACKTPSAHDLRNPATNGQEQGMLQQDAADYQALFDNEIIGLCFSADRRIVRCNRRFEEMLGYEAGQLDDRSFMELYPTEKAYRQHVRAISRHFLTHRMIADERLMMRRDGGLFWCAVSGRRLDSDGFSRKAVWILQDISSRKHAEDALHGTHERLEKLVEGHTLKVRKKSEALQKEVVRRRGIEEKLRESKRKYRALFEMQPMDMTQCEQLKGQARLQKIELARASRLNLVGEMGAAIAHELGQPLSSAANYLSGCRLRLAEGKYDHGAVFETITEALHHVEQAGDIVKHIHQFVRRHQPNKVLCDLDSIIKETLRFMDSECRQQAAVITLQQEQALHPVMLDPLEFKQVLANLIKNGLEAMAAVPEPQRSLVISTRIKEGKWIEISVSDRGPGVSPSNRHEIFNPFFSTKPDGIGLGLAICRSIVESHGGTLTVGSGSEGGATFKIAIPCEAA